MADVTKEISVLIRLRGGAAFQAEAASVSRSIKNIGNAGKDAKLESLSTTFNKWGNSLMSLGRSLLPVSAGIAGIGYESAKAANTFQKNMTLLVTQANYPRKHIQALTKDILSLSTAVGQTPTDLAAAAYWPASGSPQQQRQIAQILKYASMGAGVGQDTVSDVARSMSQIMSTGFYKNNPQALIALMDTAIGQGHMHMADLMSATSTGIMPILRTASGTRNSLPEMYAMIAALTSTGVSPTTAASRMRLTYTSMLSPTAAGQKAMAGVGLGQYALAHDVRRNGLVSALQDLVTHMQESRYSSEQQNSTIATIFGKSRGIASVASLLTMMNRIRQILQLESHGNVKRFHTHWNEYRHTFQFQLNRLKAILQRAIIPLGNIILKDLIPVMKTFASVLTGLSKWFQHLSPSTQKLIVKIGAFIAILGPGLIILGGLFKLFGAVFEIFGRGKKILKGVWKVFTILWDVGEALAMGLGVVLGVSTAVAAGILILIGAVLIVAFIFRKQLWGAVKFVVNILKDGFVLAIKGGITVLKFLWNVFKALANIVKKVIGFFGHLGGNLLHAGGHMLGSVFHSLTSWIPGLAAGGSITGSGLTLVGENGPEILNLPRGSTVVPLEGNAMSSLRAGLGGGGGISLTANVLLDSKVVATSVSKVYRSANNRK